MHMYAEQLAGVHDPLKLFIACLHKRRKGKVQARMQTTRGERNLF